MRIFSINNLNTNNLWTKSSFQHSSIAFGANIHAPQLKYSPSDFFIKIPDYGKSLSWVKRIIKTTDCATEMISDGSSFDEVLQYIAKNVGEANSRLKGFGNRNKLIHSGILRTKRAGWDYKATWERFNIATPYGSDAIPSYKSYENRFDNLFSNPLDNQFLAIDLTTVDYDTTGKFLKHPSSKLVNNALDLINEKYDYLMTNYVMHDKKPSLDDVNKNIAEMRWIFAHSMPFERGSDAIGNVLMKAMYKSMGIKTYSPRKGLSFDLEAFCTNLDEYREKFSTYFTKQPVYIG